MVQTAAALEFDTPLLGRLPRISLADGGGTRPCSIWARRYFLHLKGLASMRDSLTLLLWAQDLSFILVQGSHYQVPDV